MNTINPKDFDKNVYKLLDNDWCLIAAYDKNREGIKYNAMTASWGGFGVLWSKNVFFCFIRPQRYTKEFVDKSEYISLSFFDEAFRSALTICGRTSGRDGDKIKNAGLTPVIADDRYVQFEQAKTTIVGRKLFCADMKPEDFLDKSLIDKNYPNNDFHTVYVCEILQIESNE